MGECVISKTDRQKTTKTTSGHQKPTTPGAKITSAQNSGPPKMINHQQPYRIQNQSWISIQEIKSWPQQMQQRYLKWYQEQYYQQVSNSVIRNPPQQIMTRNSAENSPSIFGRSSRPEILRQQIPPRLNLTGDQFVDDIVSPTMFPHLKIKKTDSHYEQDSQQQDNKIK